MRAHWTRRVALVATAFALALATPAAASQVRPVNLEEMAGRADRIFRGRCLEVRQSFNETIGRSVVHATFAVDRAVKGELAETVTIKTIAGERAAAPAAGATFREGEEVVLFLYGDSPLGLTSAVGLGQGKFTVFEDKLGRKRALNPFGNRHVLRDLSPTTKQRLALTPASTPEASEIEPERLLDWATTLQR